MIHRGTLSIGRRRALTTNAALSAVAGLSVGTGEALAQNLAHCQFQAHVSFAYNGVQPGTANCQGMLNGGLVEPAGPLTVLDAPAFTGAVGPYGGMPGAARHQHDRIPNPIPSSHRFQPVGRICGVAERTSAAAARRVAGHGQRRRVRDGAGRFLQRHGPIRPRQRPAASRE
jgi:hypothetical protein